MQLLLLALRRRPLALRRALAFLGAAFSLLVARALHRRLRGDFRNARGQKMPSLSLLEQLRRWSRCARAALPSLQWALECQRQHGDIWRHMMGITVASPAIAKQVLASNWPRAQGGRLRRALLFQHLLGHTTPSVSHDAWHVHRKLANATLCHSDLARLCRAVLRCAVSGLARQWDMLCSTGGTATVDARDWVSRVVMYIIGCTVLGLKFDAMMTDPQEAIPYVRAMTQGLRLAAHPLLSVFPWLRRIPLARWRYSQPDLSLLDAFVLKTLREKQLEANKKHRLIAANEHDDSTNGLVLRNPTSDWLDLVIADKSLTLSNEEVVKTAKDLLLAGQEFSSSMVSCALAMLGTHPEVQMRARAEIASSFPGQRCEDLSSDCLEQLVYLTAVIKETLRLFPPASSLAPRVCPVHGAELAGYKIPKGTLVDVSVHALHRDPQFWSRPEDFDPGRFLEDSERSEFAWIAMPAQQGCTGFGSQGCIGCDFAWTETRIILAVLLQSFIWRVPQGFELNLDRHDAQDCIPLIITKVVQEQESNSAQEHVQPLGATCAGSVIPDWTGAEMVHGPLIIVWAFLPNRLQSRAVCVHWHHGCSSCELGKWRTGGRSSKSALFAAKTSDGLVKGAKANSQGSHISLMMSLAGLIIGFLDICWSSSKLFALAHILLLYVLILLLSSHISARLYRAGLYQRLEKGHWMFDGAGHWVIMLGLLTLLVLANLVLPRTNGIVQLCPTFRVMPVLLFVLGCFANSTVTKHDFHKFVAARTGRDIKVSTIRLPRSEKPMRCPICCNPSCDDGPL